ncbi:MAG: enoyl-CoA hydratase/isomerase family protein [Actinomycetes bacterium]
MQSEHNDVLRCDDADGVRVLTFQRPDALNAFNQTLWYATAAALEDAATNDDLRCVVLTGSGRAFSAGQDLTELSNPSVFEGQEPGYRRLMPVVESFPKVLIAAVNGLGVGIGLTLLLHCDVVLIAESARLKVPFLSLGVTTEASASLLMPAVMGRQRAMEVLLTEPWIDAQQAVADGLALRSVPDDQLMDQTMQLALQVGALPLAPLVATKQLVRDGTADAIRMARERELEAFEHLVADLMRSAT